MTRQPLQIAKVLSDFGYDCVGRAANAQSSHGRGLMESGVKILQYRHKGDRQQSHFDEAKHLSRDVPGRRRSVRPERPRRFRQTAPSAFHLGQEDLAPTAARAKSCPTKCSAISTHNADATNWGDTEPVEYLSIGPISQRSQSSAPTP